MGLAEARHVEEAKVTLHSRLFPRTELAQHFVKYFAVVVLEYTPSVNGG